MEEVLAAMRDDGAPVTPAITDALFACLDTLQEMVNRVAAAWARRSTPPPCWPASTASPPATPRPPSRPPPPQVAATAAPAAAADEVLSDYDRMVVADAHERGLSVLRVDVAFEDGCQLPAVRAFMVVQELEAHRRPDHERAARRADRVRRGGGHRHVLGRRQARTPTWMTSAPAPSA